MWQLDGPVELLEMDEVVDVIRQGRTCPDNVAYVDGLPVAATPQSRTQVIATLQPMGGKDLQLLPEGFRERSTLWMWQAHRTPSQDNIRVDLTDIVLYGGRAYQVQSSEDWGSYTRAMLVGCDTGSFAGAIDAAHVPAVYPAADAQ
jgi:hypothetical protein